MKAATLGTVAAPCITRNPELNREDNAAFFPEKMEKARQIIARAGLPLVNCSASNTSVKENKIIGKYIL